MCVWLAYVTSPLISLNRTDSTVILLLGEGGGVKQSLFNKHNRTKFFRSNVNGAIKWKLYCTSTHNLVDYRGKKINTLIICESSSWTRSFPQLYSSFLIIDITKSNFSDLMWKWYCITRNFNIFTKCEISCLKRLCHITALNIITHLYFLNLDS